MTTMYAGSTFERLPPNILDVILEYLDPRTLLNVGRTSRTLIRAAQLNWGLWARVLRFQCIDNGIFLPTYPISGMPIPMLQRSAFRVAYLWDTAVKIQERSRERILRHTAFWVPVALEANPFHIITRVEVIPGGRYLLGLSMKRLTLFDLTGPDVRFVWPNLFMIDDLNIPLTDDRQLSLESYWFSPEGSVLRVLVEVSPKDQFSNPWHMVYEIDVAQTHIKSKFKPLRSMILDGGLVDNRTTQESICGNMAAIYVHSQETMVLWDFINNKCATWKIRNMSQCAKVVLDEDYVTQYTMDGVYKWPIPRLFDINSSQIHMSGLLVSNTPYHFPLPNPDVILNKIWYRSRPGRRDLLPDMAMIWSNKSLGETTTTVDAGGSFITVSLYRKDTTGFSSTRVCIPQAWMATRKAMAWSDDGDIELTGDKRQIYQVSLCPHSGRLAGIRVRMAPDGVHQIYELAIVDLLPPHIL